MNLPRRSLAIHSIVKTSERNNYYIEVCTLIWPLAQVSPNFARLEIFFEVTVRISRLRNLLASHYCGKDAFISSASALTHTATRSLNRGGDIALRKFIFTRVGKFSWKLFSDFSVRGGQNFFIACFLFHVTLHCACDLSYYTYTLHALIEKSIELSSSNGNQSTS